MSMEKDMLGQTAAVYLRKSRMEEGMDTDEVLRRHRQGLDECARRHGYVFAQVNCSTLDGLAGEKVFNHIRLTTTI